MVGGMEAEISCLDIRRANGQSSTNAAIMLLWMYEIHSQIRKRKNCQNLTSHSEKKWKVAKDVKFTKDLTAPFKQNSMTNRSTEDKGDNANTQCQELNHF
jgi:hypothetical protein